MDTDAHPAAGDRLHRESVVDLGGADVIEAERGGGGARQVVAQRRQLVRRERGAAREKFVQEAIEMVVVAVGQQAAALEQPCDRPSAGGAGLLERPGLGLVPVRGVEQLVLEGGDLRRAVAFRQPLGPRRDLLLDALFLLRGGERKLERRLGGGLEAALAAPVEVHRRRVQLHQDPGRLRRGRVASDVFARQLLEAEFPRAAAFPEELDLQPAGEFLRLGEQLAGRRPLEGQQHARRLDLRAPAVRALDLERRGRALEHRARLQLAVFLIEKVHAKTRVCGGGVAGSSAGCGRRRG